MLVPIAVEKRTKAAPLNDVVGFHTGQGKVLPCTMATEWLPSLTLPVSWRPHVTQHPTQLSESINLAATPLPSAWARTYTPFTTPHGLSYAQAEAAFLAMYACGARGGGGFCLGDATGVGKGRTLAAIALERTVAQGSVCVWVTTSTSLFADAKRDLVAVCGTQRSEAMLGNGASAHGRVILVTYRQLGYTETFDSVSLQLQDAGAYATLLFDESHIARTVGTGAQSKTAINVLRLQRSVPHAGVVYSSATPVSEVSRIGCMERLGLWPVDAGETTYGAQRFADTMTARGPAAMELVALHLKRQGLYVARQLPAATESVQSTPCVLTGDQRALYDRCAHFWTRVCASDAGSRLASRQQAFFRRFITAMKVPTLLKRARLHLEAGRSVIITLQSTGDAAQQRGGGGALSDDLLRAAVTIGADPVAVQRELISDLPREPLDEIMDALRPYGIVELTGRVRPGAITTAVEQFQTGQVRVAVVTTAGSHGLSLHDVSRCNNGAQRAHLLLELPWSAEAFVQQCGRSSRTGQSSAPLYELMVSDIPAESRFSLAVWQRLQSMGALTRGDRNTNYTALSALGSHVDCEQAAPVRVIVRILMCRAVRGLLLRVRPSFLPEQSPPRCTCHRRATATGRTRQRQQCELCRDVHGLVYGDATEEERRQDARVVETKHGPLGRFLSILEGHGGLQHCPEVMLRALAAALPHAERSTCGVNMVSAQGAHVPGRWSPATHHLSPPAFQVRVEAVMMCANRPGPLSALPSDVVSHICQMMSDSLVYECGTDEQALGALQHLVTQTRQSYTWFTKNLTTTRLLNTMMAMPVHLQGVLYKISRQAAERSRSARTWQSGSQQLPCSVDTYVTGPGVRDLDVRVTIGRQNARGARPLRVAVAHRAPDDPVQCPESVVATGLTARGTLVVVTRDERGLHGYLPGRARVASAQTLAELTHKLRAVSVTEANAKKMVAHDHDWGMQWASQREAHHLRRREFAKTLAERHANLIVATDTALDMWAMSRGQVLRCVPPVSEAPFTCLVLDPSKLG